MLSIGWLIFVAPVPLLWWLSPHEFLRGVFVGTSLTGATAAVWFVVVQSTGTAPIMMGDQAEQWTAQAIRKLGRNWRVVNRFLLSSSGDLDHVAVGPAGVLVVETKWSASSWHSRDGIERVHAAVGQVQRSTRQLRLWTEVKKASVRVRPVVVLWGGGGWADTEPVRYIDGVAVVEGNAFRDWLRALEPDPASSQETTQAVWDALDTQARLRDGHDPAAAAIPLSVNDFLIKLGLFVAAAALGFTAIATVLNTTGSSTITTLCGLSTSALLLVVHRRWRAVRTLALGALIGAGLPTLLLAAAFAVALVI
ncbi:MAG: hypothetical protein JWM84_1977 [Nocardioides sp.]|nr:hypothetical protein [Nocardioides sp.]